MHNLKNFNDLESNNVMVKSVFTLDELYQKIKVFSDNSVHFRLHVDEVGVMLYLIGDQMDGVVLTETRQLVSADIVAVRGYKSVYNESSLKIMVFLWDLDCSVGVIKISNFTFLKCLTKIGSDRVPTRDL